MTYASWLCGYAALGLVIGGGFRAWEHRTGRATSDSWAPGIGFFWPFAILIWLIGFGLIGLDNVLAALFRKPPIPPPEPPRRTREALYRESALDDEE